MPVRTLGVAFLVVVALAFTAFGIDDLLMSSLPPMHREYFSRLPGGASPEVESLVYYMFDGQGGLFLGSGLSLLVLAAGPIRRGDRLAIAAAAPIVVFGSAGIILCLYNMHARIGVPAGLLAVGLVGLALCLIKSRAA
jgi:hypothetical protein